MEIWQSQGVIMTGSSKDNSQTQKSRWCTVKSSANLMLNDDYTILPIWDLALSQIFPLLDIFKRHRWQRFLFLVMLLACISSGSQHPSQSENPSGYKSFYTDRIVIYEEVIYVLHVSMAVTVFTIFSVKNLKKPCFWVIGSFLFHEVPNKQALTNF